MRVRSRKRSRLRIFAKVAGFVLAGAALVFGWIRFREPFVNHPYFALAEIRVISKPHRLPVGDLLELARLREGQSIWRVSLEKVRQEIEMHPLVERAAARREFPNRVILEVLERQPVAIMALDHLYYVDGNGILFKRIGSRDPADYPILTGFSRKAVKKGDEQTRTRVQQGLRFLRLYRARNLPFQISEVRVEPTEGLTFFLRDKPLAVKLRKDHWEQGLVKFRRVMSLWKDREFELSSMDLSFPQQAIVRLKRLSQTEDGKDEKTGQMRQA